MTAIAVYMLIIPGRLPGLNEATAANRSHAMMGAKLKQLIEQEIGWEIRRQLQGVAITMPVHIDYFWFERDKRRDKDNISGWGRKVIQDALVFEGILIDDGWDEIVGFNDCFAVDKACPRIEVRIEEVQGLPPITKKRRGTSSRRKGGR